jgi:hypothetical protein
MTTSLKLDDIYATFKILKKNQRMMMVSFEELPPHLQQRKQTQNNDLSN